MAHIIQQTLFSWKDVERSGELERLRMVIEVLPDDDLMNSLEAERKGRRDDYPIRPVWNSILAGITRASVLQLARELGYTVREMVIPRELMYVCDEAFFTGTAVEVTPVTSCDHVLVGDGEVGPVTKAIKQAFFGIVKGELPDRHGWLTKVPRAVGATAS